MDGSRKSCLLSSFFYSFLGQDVDLRQFQVDGRDGLQYVAQVLKFNLGFKMNHSKTLGKYHTQLSNPPSNLCAESRPCISGDYK